MKIVHVCLCGSYNDNWGYQDNLIPKYNKKDGHDVTVITSIFINSTKHEGYEKVNLGEYFLEDGVKIIRIPFKKFFISKIVEKLRIYEGLYEKLDQERPDLIFMHGIQFLDMLEVVRYVKDNPNCKLVADNHASYYNSARNFLSKEILHKIIWRRTIQKSLSYVNKFFMLAPGCKDFAKDMYSIPEEKMEYLYLGADTERIDFEKKKDIKTRVRQELDIQLDDFVLITGGKLSKKKRIKLLLDVLKRIDSKNIKLIIFGAFSDDIKDELLYEISQDNRVRYIGWLNGEDVYDYYLASDVAVFPGTKSALWEQAICSGLPLICKRWKGMEYVDVGGNCIFIDGDDEDKIVESIELLANDKELYAKMANVSRTKGYDKFSYEKISRQAIDI